MTKPSAKQNIAKSAEVTILKNPRITEKAAKANAASVYVFDVATTATKSEIAKAFTAAYKHVPVKVNVVTISRKSYFRRTNKGSQLGYGAKGRKAYVYLPKGVTIEIM